VRRQPAGHRGERIAYTPEPIDTSGIELPPELERLREKLAENTHDVWARRRIAEGWTHGAERDDAAKKHPDIVPYAELSESEREYDRQTAIEVLKAIVALGYEIVRRQR
jgi:hypothetical protein